MQRCAIARNGRFGGGELAKTLLQCRQSGHFQSLRLAAKYLPKRKGTYIQRVPLSGYTAKPIATLKIGAKKIDLMFPDDFVAYSYIHQPNVAVKDSELVFVGYGAIAPEYGWDDYKSIDLHGKTLVMLIPRTTSRPLAGLSDAKDPSRLDQAVFFGKAMTYYGRWTYKYEVAAKLGTGAAIIVHETVPAAYPWSVVENSYGKENFAVRSDAPNPDYPSVAAGLHHDRARELLAAAGTTTMP